MQQNLQKELYTTKDIMDLFCVDRNTVYNWKRRGVLRFIRIGGKFYAPKQEVEKFIKEG